MDTEVDLPPSKQPHGHRIAAREIVRVTLALSELKEAHEAFAAVEVSHAMVLRAP